MVWLLPILVLSIAAISYLLVGRLIRALVKRDIVDVPNQRSLHTGKVPRGGGLVIIGLLLLSLLLMGMIFERMLVFFTIALLVMGWSALSWWDDRSDLSARIRLMVQGVLAVATILAFGYISTVQINAESSFGLFGMGAAVTFLAVLWLVNLYNFMDGMDGLAASQTIIAALTLGFWFGYVGDMEIAACCFILAAASYGFLLWNWHPAKIFLGDVGSIGIGAFFSIIIIYGNTRYQLPVIGFLLLFGVFLIDASITIIRRAVDGEKIWLPHRRHFYQRLEKLGYRQDRIVIGLIVLMLLCSVLATVSVVDRDRMPMAIILELVLLIVGAVFVVSKEKNKLSG